MALRLIELIIPEDQSKYVQELLKDYQEVGVWYENLLENKILVRVLLQAEHTEKVMDIFEQNFSIFDDFRIMLFPIEASLPRPEPQEETPPPSEAESTPEQPEESNADRISREELYADIADSAKITKVFFIMVALSSVVAAIGLLRGNVAVIIGAMVIAPLIGPNVALSLATTLGDIDLSRNALKTNIAGILVTLLISVAIGSIFHIDPASPEIASRTAVGIGDIILALSAGCAGALAFTTGISTILIGVIIAVALLPPLVTCGMLFGAGYWDQSFNAMILSIINVISINLAGVVTFLLQGIKPVTWWEAGRAKKATRRAISIWVSLLILLVIVIVLSQKG
jgi:uncharacterized hydrophobic protein (TIGR00341 family)